MDNEKDFLLSNLINSLVKDEWGAVAAYESAIATLTDVGSLDIISILEDIRDEEYVHIGQLESCLSLLKGDPTEYIDDGSEEGFEQLELPEEDDEEDGIELKGESLEEGIPGVATLIVPEFDYDEVSEVIDDMGGYGDYNDIIDELMSQFNIDKDTAEEWFQEYATTPDDDDEEDLELSGDYYDADHAAEWVERHPYGYYNSENDYGLDDEYEDEDDDDFENESLKEDTFAARLKGDTAGSTRYAFVKATDEEDAKRQLDKKFSKKGWKVTDIGVADPKATNPYDALKKESKSGLSEKEMKKIICDMVTKYDASEEEVFDELQSQDQNITRDVAHRLYKMCNGDKNKRV